MTLEIVEGTTAKRRVQLLDDGAAALLTGLNAPKVYLTDKQGQRVEITDATEWIAAETATFYLLLAELTLSPARSPYRLRFEVTDSQSLIDHWPSDERGIELKIVPR
jgi:hypothetical protein